MSGNFALDVNDYSAGAEKGRAEATELSMHAKVEIGDLHQFIHDPEHPGKLSGEVDFPLLGANIVSQHGVFNLFKPVKDSDETHMIYEMSFQVDNEDYYLAGHKIVKDDPGFDLWSDTTTLYTNLHKGKDKTFPIIGSGILNLGIKELLALVSTIDVPNATSASDKASAISSFGQFFLGELWNAYGASKLNQEQETKTELNDDNIDFDVVVIGSGFGGAVSACRLAQKGYSVCILERGHHWQTEDYPRAPDDNWWWDKDNPEKKNGWIDLQLYDDMGVAQGAGVGGGSLIYANIFIDAKPFVFESGWPKEINYTELTPYYEKTEKMINPQKIPDNQLTQRAKLMKDAAEKIQESARYTKLDLAVSFSQEWNYQLPDPFNESHSKTYINAQGIEQGTCVHCGNCDIGCQVKAKNTLDLNYIPLAEQHGAIVKPLHLVNKISPLSNDAYRINYSIIDSKNNTLNHDSINAKRVILAAGTMGTNELLLRCRDEFKTLPKLSPMLGKNWSSNGDFLTPAVYPEKDVSPTRGPTISSAIDFLDGSKEGNRFFVEDGGFPDVLGNALGEINGKNKFGLFANSLSMAIRDRNPLSCIMPWFGQAVDAADGELSLCRSWLPPFRKKMNLSWNINRSESAVQAMVDMHKELSEATGGTPLVPPSWKYMKDLVTPHPLGGCKMGNDKNDGVVNHKGEVFDYPGLYVADGSIIPVAIGLNPSKTIAALAERIADLIEK